MALKIVFNNFNEPVEPFPAMVFSNIPALFCTQRSELIILMEKIKIVKEEKRFPKLLNNYHFYTNIQSNISSILVQWKQRVLNFSYKVIWW